MPELCSTKSAGASRSPSPIPQENTMLKRHCVLCEGSRKGRALSSSSDNVLTPHELKLIFQSVQVSPQQPSSLDSCASLPYVGRRRSLSIDSCGSLNSAT